MDHRIQSTAGDALRAKAAAVRTGYYDDPYISLFAPADTRGVQPIIKRGTHARVVCIAKALRVFGRQHAGGQVVVLGAGKDTSAFRLDIEADWFEIDHDTVVREKCAVVCEHARELGLQQQSERVFRFLVRKGSYRLVDADLREDPEQLIQLLRDAGWQSTRPTLIVSECVQMYLPAMAAPSLFRAFAQACHQCYIVLYEPILGNDPFGRVMQDNLLQAGMAGRDSCLVLVRTIDDHQRRLAEAGFASTACDMWTAYETILDAEDRTRANACEFLDEVEEWMLIMRHYCLIVGCTSSADASFCNVGEASPMGFVTGRCEHRALS